MLKKLLKSVLLVVTLTKMKSVLIHFRADFCVKLKVNWISMYFGFHKICLFINIQINGIFLVCIFRIPWLGSSRYSYKRNRPLLYFHISSISQNYFLYHFYIIHHSLKIFKSHSIFVCWNAEKKSRLYPAVLSKKKLMYKNLDGKQFNKMIF